MPIVDFVPVKHRLFGAVHAADLGAIGHAKLWIAGASALDPNHFLWFLTVGGAAHDARCRARGTQKPFHGQSVDHIGDPPTPILAQRTQRVKFIACCKNDGPHTLFEPRGFLLKIDGTDRARLFAQTTLALEKVGTIVDIDHRLLGHSLWRKGVDGLSRPNMADVPTAHGRGHFEIAVKNDRDRLGTLFGAFSAGRAQVPVHKSGLATDAHPEITLLPYNLLNLRIHV